MSASAQLQQQLSAIVTAASLAGVAGRHHDAATGYEGAARFIDAALQHRRHELSAPEIAGLSQYRARVAAAAAHHRGLQQQAAPSLPPPSWTANAPTTGAPQHRNPTAATSSATVPSASGDLGDFTVDDADMDAMLGDGDGATDAGSAAASDAPKPAPKKRFVTNAPRVVPRAPAFVPRKSSPPPSSLGGSIGGSVPQRDPSPPRDAPSSPPSGGSVSGGGGGGGAPKKSSGGGDGLGAPPSINFSGLTAPKCGASSSGARKGYQARASDLVYRAVEVATQLVQRGELKRAVDMLQHALDDSRHEENVPANMKTVEELCAQLRQRYVRENKPRLVQDNPISDAEMEVLSRAGTTSRILLPMWDDINDGFPRENVWYPATGLYTDDFTPQLAQSQTEHRAVFDRVTPVFVPPATPPPVASPTPTTANPPDKNAPQGQSPAPEDAKPKEGEDSAAVDADAELAKLDKEIAEGSAGSDTTATDSTTPAANEPPKPPPPQLYVVRRSGVDPHRIRQSVVGDCSFVCSLIVCANIQQRYPTVRLITSAIYPQLADGTPAPARSGKYCVKMLVNGTTRIITIDDRLPMVPKDDAAEEIDGEISATHGYPTKPRRLLCTHSRDPNELWPSLLEKAFIKVCGGSYDWPGSTSSADLYMLSAWLPDVVDLPGGGKEHSKTFDRELQWRRMLACQPRGAVAMTLNTPPLDAAARERLGLVSSHAYAVLDVRDVNGLRMVKIKNPWGRKDAWKGRFSVYDGQNLTAALRQALAYTDEEADGGVFWVHWDDLVATFATMHLSWNPFMLFPSPQGTMTRPTRLAVHARFDYADSYLLLPQAQLRLSAEAPANLSRRIHLVLARHIHDHREFREHPDTGSRVLERPFLAVHVYDVTGAPSASALGAGVATARTHTDVERCYGRRVQGDELPESCLVHNGIYRNVAYQTVSFTAPATGYREYTVVVAQLVSKEMLAKGRPQPFTFSLTAHTALPEGPKGLAIRQIPYRTLRFAKDVAGQWQKGATCGGRLGSSTFGFNPQWTFTLSQPSRVIVSLVSPCGQPIMAHLVRHPDNAAPQHPTVRETPWQRRIDTVHDFADALASRGGTYARHDALVDSTLAACYINSSSPCAGSPTDANNDQAPPAPPPGPPPAPTTATPAPRPQGMLRLVMPPAAAQQGAGPQEHKVAIGPRWPQLDARPARTLPCLAAMVYQRLATPRLTRVAIAGKAVEDGATLAQALTTAEASLWGAADQAPPVLVAPQTDDLSRTQELAKCEAELFKLAQQGLQLVATMSPDDDAPSRKRKAAALEEMSTQLLLRLDAAPTPTEPVAQCRKALVEAVQLVHSVVDAITEPTPGAAAAPSPASPPPPPPSGPPPASAAREVLQPGGGILPAGAYTVVASAWLKGEPGTFRLSVEAEEEVDLQPVPAEGAGWHAVTVPQVAWPKGSATIACQRPCDFAVRALFVPDTPSSKPGEETPVALAAVLCEAGTGKPIVRTPFGTSCRLPAVRLDGGAKYRIEVQGDAKAAHRGRVVLRCAASHPESVTVANA